jgi:hypothetical protein
MSATFLIKQVGTWTKQAILRNRKHGPKQLQQWSHFPEILFIVCPREGNIISVTKEKRTSSNIKQCIYYGV